MAFYPGIFDTAKFDESRFDVVKPIRLPQLQTITRKRRVEGSRDPNTGKPIVTYVEETVQGNMRPLNPNELQRLPAGAIAENFLMLITQDGFKMLDRALFNSVEYEAHNIAETWLGDSFAYRSIFLKKVV